MTHPTANQEQENSSSSLGASTESPSNRDLKSRLMKSLGAQMFGNIVTLIIQISSVPLFMYFWGAQLYGEWLLLSTIPAYFAMSDLGFAAAAGTAMTIRVGANDREGALEVFQSAQVIVVVISLLLTLGFFILLPFLPIVSWLHIKLIPVLEVRWLLVVLILQVFFALQRQMIETGYRCDGHYIVGATISTLKRLFDFLAMVGALACGGGPLIVATAYLTAEILGNFFVSLDLRRRNPWLQFGFQHATRKTIYSLIIPAISFMGFPVAYALGLQGMLTVIGIVLGPIQVALFSTMRTLTRTAGQMLSAITQSVWIELSTAFGKGNMELARTLHRKTGQISFWLSLGLCGLLLVVAHPLYMHWTRGKFHFDSILLVLLLIVIFFNNFWSASHIVSIASNRHSRIALQLVIVTSLFLVISIPLTHLLGVYGAVLALIMIDAVMVVLVVQNSLSIVHDDLGGYLRTVLTPPVDLPQRIMRVFRRA